MRQGVNRTLGETVERNRKYFRKKMNTEAEEKM